jgi:phosphotransferase system HPr (HPr) family protein
MSARPDVTGGPVAGRTDQVVEQCVVLPADLHARPAGQVTRTVSAYDAVVLLDVDGRDLVDARSVLAVMGLGAVTGQTVTIRGTGLDAVAAVAAVAAVLAAAQPLVT